MGSPTTASNTPLPHLYTWGDRREAMRAYRELVKMGFERPRDGFPFLGTYYAEKPEGAPHFAETDFDLIAMRRPR